jgi:hypothetical protein
MSRETFYGAILVPNTDFVLKEFGLESDGIMLLHDGTGDVTISWTGETGSDDGLMKPSDGFLAFDNLNKSKIALKSTVNNDPVRIFAWRRSKS